jgi:hypothetical protein
MEMRNYNSEGLSFIYIFISKCSDKCKREEALLIQMILLSSP